MLPPAVSVMTPVALVIIVVCALVGIGWLRAGNAAARRQLLNKILFVAGIFVLLLALFSGRLHPLFAAAGGALLLLQRLLAIKRLLGQGSSAQEPSTGASSRVSTRILDMSLDHDSGDMHGKVREGRFAGRLLSQLSIEELLQLLAQCHDDDAQSAALLEAYLDHTHGEGWREHVAPGAREQQTVDVGVKMSAAEARDVLGVGETAGHDEIVAAHRKLMQKIHPDRGGSTYLASKVNQAKELLLKLR
jgi:hypothetical protein